MNKQVVIEIEKLTKSFDTHDVLKNFSMKLMQGENLVIIGRSGIGKSVLIKCIIGLMKADEGSIKVLGEDITVLKGKKLDNLRKKIGFCFQGSALYDSLSVRENLQLPLERNLKMKDDEKMEALIQQALSDVGLLEAIDQAPVALSGGMRKRLSIARTIVLKPAVMLYDEPTGGLDPITSMEINNLILSMQQKYSVSSIIITHDITCARITSDRMIFIKEGGIGVEGTFDTFLKQSEDLILKSFFDYFKVNEHEAKGNQK